MPIIVSCGCGQQLRVADQNAGQLVRCPACQAILSVPGGAAPPAPSSASAGGVVKFNCSCGTLMQAKQEHAGKLVQCPRCQSKVVVPAMQPVASASAPAKSTPPPPPAPVRAKVQANGAAKMPPTPPTRRSPPPPPPSTVKKARPPAPPVAAFDDEAEDFDAPPVRRGRGRSGSRSGSGSRSLMPWILAAAVVLLLAGGGLAWWLMRGKTPDNAGAPSGPDYGRQSLAFVPGTAQGFVSVRVADLWNSPLAKKGLEEAKKLKLPDSDDPAGALEKQLGVKPQDLERVTFVAADTKKMMWFVVASSKPFDRKKILEAGANKGSTEKKDGDKTYYVLGAAGPEQESLHFVDDHILLFGPEKAIKQAMGYGPGKTVKGALDGALQVAEGKHALVAGGVPPADLLAVAKAQLPKEAAAFRPLLDLKSATIVVDLDANLTLQVSARFPDGATAAKAKIAVEGAVATGRFLLPSLQEQLTKMFGAEQGTTYFKKVEKVSDSVKVEQKDADLSLEVKVPTDLLQDAIPLAPELLMPKAKPGPQRGGEGFGPPPGRNLQPPGGFPKPPPPR